MQWAALNGKVITEPGALATGSFEPLRESGFVLSCPWTRMIHEITLKPTNKLPSCIFVDRLTWHGIFKVRDSNKGSNLDTANQQCFNRP